MPFVAQSLSKLSIILSTEGWTYTNKALIVAKNQLFQLSNGARPGVTKVCNKN